MLLGNPVMRYRWLIFAFFSRFEDISLLRLETPIVWLNVYRLFLSRGADIHIRNKDGNTPAMVVKVFPVS